MTLTSRSFPGVLFFIKYYGFWKGLWYGSITSIFNLSCNISITVEDKTLEIWKPGIYQALYSIVQIFWVGGTSFLTFSISVKSHISIVFWLNKILKSKFFSWKVILSPMIIFANRSRVSLAFLVIEVNSGISQYIYLCIGLRISITFFMALVLQVLLSSGLKPSNNFWSTGCTFWNLNL